MSRFEQSLTYTLEFLLAMALTAIAAIVVAQALLSFLFDVSIVGGNEIITKLFVYTTAIGAAVEVGRREHIAILIVVEALPQPAQLWVGKLALLAVAAFNVVVTVASFRWIAKTGDYLMPTTQLPQAAAQLAIPIGCGLAVLYCLLRLAGSSRDDEQHSESGEADAA